ncbi:MAG: hypothetical protein CMN06_11175 [Roseibacillus sp.]|nr:hypothetical protein [Roseibacillus sp.]
MVCRWDLAASLCGILMGQNGRLPSGQTATLPSLTLSSFLRARPCRDFFFTSQFMLMLFSGDYPHQEHLRSQTAPKTPES